MFGFLRRRNEHWAKDRLSLYLDRQLDPADKVKVESHLNACQACREDLESLRATVAALKRLAAVSPARPFMLPVGLKPTPHPVALPRLRVATAVVAALLVAVVSADAFGVFARPRAPLSAPAMAPAALAPSPSPAPAPAAAMAVPATPTPMPTPPPAPGSPGPAPTPLPAATAVPTPTSAPQALRAVPQAGAAGSGGGEERIGAVSPRQATAEAGKAAPAAAPSAPPPPSAATQAPAAAPPPTPTPGQKAAPEVVATPEASPAPAASVADQGETARPGKAGPAGAAGQAGPAGSAAATATPSQPTPQIPDFTAVIRGSEAALAVLVLGLGLATLYAWRRARRQVRRKETDR